MQFQMMQDYFGKLNNFVMKLKISWKKDNQLIENSSNQAAQVQSLFLFDCWNFYNGSENPANLTTRGEFAKKSF